MTKALTLSPACDLCGGERGEETLQLGRRALARCVDCGLVQLLPRPTAEELSSVYDTGDYYTHETPRLHRSRADRVRNAVLDTFWSYPDQRGNLARLGTSLALRPLKYRAMPVPFPGDAPVLDVGCGNGQRLLELQERGCTDLYGVEPTAGAAAKAREGTKAKICTGLLEDAGFPTNHFQLIIMNQVLEHVPSPSQTLKHVRTLLRPGGALYMTVPNFGSWEAALFGRYWSGLQIPAHLHHFTPAPLRSLLESAGFRITTWRTDTVLAVTAASLADWHTTSPSRLGDWLLKLPRAAYVPFTQVADWLGRGQMLRVVAQAA